MQTGMSDDLENVTDAPKTSIIDRELNRLNIDIVGLQETRLAGFGSTPSFGRACKKRKRESTGLALP